jgi:hypothetical protein
VWEFSNTPPYDSAMPHTAGPPAPYTSLERPHLLCWTRILDSRRTLCWLLRLRGPFPCAHSAKAAYPKSLGRAVWSAKRHMALTRLTR